MVAGVKGSARWLPAPHTALFARSQIEKLRTRAGTKRASVKKQNFIPLLPTHAVGLCLELLAVDDEKLIVVSYFYFVARLSGRCLTVGGGNSRAFIFAPFKSMEVLSHLRLSGVQVTLHEVSTHTETSLVVSEVSEP